MGMHAQAEEMGNKMQGLAFMDARIGDSMKKMGEEMAKAPGMPIKSVTYMVMVPVDEELDLEAVLSGTPSSDPNAMMAQGNVSEQSVVLVTTTYLSNWSTNAFDADRLEIPSSYKQIESPMKAMMKSMNDQR